MRCRSRENGAVVEGVGHGGGRRLQAALAIDQPEFPVFDRMPAAPPLVGPGERDRAAGAFLEGDADVHRRDLGLVRLAFANAVGARFREQQRLLAGDVLQARQVGAQLVLAVQVDVERADVEEREVEKLGRREVDVGEEAVGRCGLAFFVEAAEEALDAPLAVPAHDARRNLVAEREGEDGGMIAELADLRGDLAPDGALQRAVVEKRDVLRPRQPDHDAQALARGRVEQVAARRRIGADGVDAERGHLPEVGGDLMQAGGTGSRRRRAQTSRRSRL